MKTISLPLLALVALAGIGCGRASQPASPGGPALPGMDPLPVQQARAYPETVTGDFLSLADFENTPGGPGGQDQLRLFSIGPAGAEGARSYVLNITRTGAGALEVTTAPNAELVFKPQVHDFRGYTLLSLAVHAETLRDDLHVTLASDRAWWRSPAALVRPGWNTVLVDIQRLAGVTNFEIASVREVRIGFAHVDTPVRFNVDDIMLINNTRPLQPAPAGMKLVKTGLNYALTGGKLPQPVLLSQGADGLWRLGGAANHRVQVVASGQPMGADETLAGMGDLRVGVVDVLELSPARVRLANTWYFPLRPGEWANLAIRQIRWEYTFYADGRWATFVEINNAGGADIAAVRIAPFATVALAGTAETGGCETAEIRSQGLGGPIARWAFLWTPETPEGKQVRANYLDHGVIRQTMGAPGQAPGDLDRDGFDETQGCYVLAADPAGHCRFALTPPPGGLRDPIFRIIGRWEGKVAVNSEGLLIRNVTDLGDGSVLFALKGLIDRPTHVEVTGRPAPR